MTPMSSVDHKKVPSAYSLQHPEHESLTSKQEAAHADGKAEQHGPRRDAAARWQSKLFVFGHLMVDVACRMLEHTYALLLLVAAVSRHCDLLMCMVVMKLKTFDEAQRGV